MSRADVDLVVFCFAEPDDSQVFAERFGGERLPRGTAMMTSSRRRLNPMRRRAVELLASHPNGVTKTLLVRAYGFDTDMIAGLVSTGLATAQCESINARGNAIEVRIRITEAGQKAIEE